MSSTPSAIPEPDPAPAGALLALGLVPGLRGVAVARLLEAFGSPAELARQPWRRLAEALGGALAGRLRVGEDSVASALQQARDWAAQPGNHLLTLLDPGYPLRLRQLADPPLLLWLKGHAGLLGDPGVAMVGSRRATPQGELDARGFARYLGNAGLTVISGLAEGIDAAAHQGALDTPGRTLAVLAHGLDRIYPPIHRDLAHRIAANGLLVSEYPLGTPALRHHFPERNRLISGLALGVVVVEAALGSGSLLTARSALEQGREVMAVPGSIHSPLSKGCHRLIREGATLVESAAEILQLLRPGVVSAAAMAPGEAAVEGTEPLQNTAESTDQGPDHKAPIADDLTGKVLAALLAGPASVDRIVAAIGLTAAQVSTILGRRELAGDVVRLSDGSYQRLISGDGQRSSPDRDS